jgi:ribosomal protein L23
LDGAYDHYANFTTVLLNNLRDRLTDVNFIGIRILPPREIASFIGYSQNFSEREELIKTWKKEKSISLTDTGYHKYFGISATAISNNSSFSVDDSATKSQIKNAFAKSLKSKKMNKKILGEFVELIA